jgi:Uma2 family endonuclease
MSALMTEDRPATSAMSPLDEWTLEDLARLPDDGRRYEIIDGSLLVSPAPAYLHQRDCTWLIAALLAHKPDGYEVLPGGNVLLPALRTRMLVPDVLAVRESDIEVADNPLAVPAGAVPLAVEVVSPSSVTMDLVTKPALYAEAGVPSYWRVERGDAGPTVRVHALSGGTYKKVRTIRPGETVTLDEPWTVVLTPPVAGGR